MIKGEDDFISLLFERQGAHAPIIIHAVVKLKNTTFGGITDLETEIRNIIYNDYGVGDQNIDSEEIYDKLVAKGIDPPKNAIGDVFLLVFS
jgi:hypothetical protein